MNVEVWEHCTHVLHSYVSEYGSVYYLTCFIVIYFIQTVVPIVGLEIRYLPYFALQSPVNILRCCLESVWTCCTL
jgi:hypothetical protein